MAAQILVKDLQKTYRVPECEEGLAATVRNLFRRRYREVAAVNNINFAIEPGEVVGFISPNGAGKTTTLKILSGLLYPTAGEVCIDISVEDPPIEAVIDQVYRQGISP